MRAIPTLKISISGVRGVVGDSLTPELVARFAQAFGTWVGGGRVVIGRDPRTSGEMVRQAVVAGLVSRGCRVSDLGVVPTPTVQLLVRQLGAQGGVVLLHKKRAAPTARPVPADPLYGARPKGPEQHRRDPVPDANPRHPGAALSDVVEQRRGQQVRLIVAGRAQGLEHGHGVLAIVAGHGQEQVHRLGRQHLVEQVPVHGGRPNPGHGRPQKLPDAIDGPHAP